MNDKNGLARALNDGDEVIMSTGATALVRGSYPAGYSGTIDILLDGIAQSETTDALTLTDPWTANDPQPGDVRVAQSDELSVGKDGEGEARGPSLRLKN